MIGFFQYTIFSKKGIYGICGNNGLVLPTYQLLEELYEQRNLVAELARVIPNRIIELARDTAMRIAEMAYRG